MENMCPKTFFFLRYRRKRGIGIFYVILELRPIPSTNMNFNWLMKSWNAARLFSWWTLIRSREILWSCSHFKWRGMLANPALPWIIWFELLWIKLNFMLVNWLHSIYEISMLLNSSTVSEYLLNKNQKKN